MLRIEGASLGFGEGDILRGASLTVASGEVVALSGANGAGKSTLARLACASLVGDAGCVSVDGIDPAVGASERERVQRLVGMVQQDADDQIVSTVVFDEVAFGPRNLGLAEDEVSARVAAALAQTGLQGFEARLVHTLSGGERQRLALAGVLAMRPSYLVLDEVTSMLDSALRSDLRKLFARLAHERGVGILVITHDSRELAAADRVLVLDGGVVTEGMPRGTAPGDALPIARRARRAGDASFRSSSSGLVLADISYTYPSAGMPALRGVSLAVRPGEVLLLAGRSGSGKSTLASIAAGLVMPDAGAVRLDGEAVTPGRVGLAFQRPEVQLFLDAVFDEIAFAPRNLGAGEDEVASRVREAARRADVPESLFARYPFDLSGGQQRRVGLASVLSLGAGAYVLDEPTAGLDAAGREALRALVRDLADGGVPVVVISHDIDEWLAVADEAAFLSGGTVVWQGPVDEVPKGDGLLCLLREPCGRLDGARELEMGAGDDVDARVKLGLLLALAVALFTVPGIAALAGSSVLLAVCLRFARMGIHDAVRALKPLAVVLAFVLAANLISLDAHAPLSIAGPLGLDPVGGLRGVVAVLRIALLLGFALVVARTATPPQLCDAVVRLLRPLGRLGVPVGDIGMALSLALRAFPLVAEELRRIRLAQRSRGVLLDEGPLAERIRRHRAVLAPLVVGLLRRADNLANAMAARCYTDGSLLVPPRPLARRDRIVLALGLAICGIMVVAGFVLQG